MKEGTYEEVKYGDETFMIDKSTGKIRHMDYDGMGDFSRFPSQGRTIKQEEDSAKIAGYAIIALIVLGLIFVFV